jgi:hypothetical protein
MYGNLERQNRAMRVIQSPHLCQCYTLESGKTVIAIVRVSEPYRTQICFEAMLIDRFLPDILADAW